MFALFCMVITWSVLMKLRQVLVTLITVAASSADGLLHAWELNLIRLDTAPDIIGIYRAASINRPSDLD